MSVRAYLPEDKLRKREEILTVAQQLWIGQADNLSSMAELASASGVAKGTLYLYFKSKDEVLLALHERDLQQFFGQVIARAEQPEPLHYQDLIEILIQSIQHSPTFLPLASLCHGLMEQKVEFEDAAAFQARISGYLQATVTALQPHLPTITSLNLLQGYAMLLGLWQLLRPTPLQTRARQDKLFMYADGLQQGDFVVVLRQSLTALYSGLFAQGASV